MVTFIDFFAEWCGPCKIMSPIFEEIEKDYTGKVEFKKVDVEANSGEAERFGVRSIPTFVILKDDREVDRKMGAMPKEMLKTWLDSYLE